MLKQLQTTETKIIIEITSEGFDDYPQKSQSHLSYCFHNRTALTSTHEHTIGSQLRGNVLPVAG